MKPLNESRLDTLGKNIPRWTKRRVWKLRWVRLIRSSDESKLNHRGMDFGPNALGRLLNSIAGNLRMTTLSSRATLWKCSLRSRETLKEYEEKFLDTNPMERIWEKTASS